MDINRFDNLIKTEILSRTTLSTYNALKCTNKEFELLANDPYTKSLHTIRNGLVSGFLMERVSYDLKTIHNYAPSRGTLTVDLGFLPEDSHILASSEQGLVVSQSPHPSRPNFLVYHVSKPATKQFRAIPNPKMRYHTSSFSIVTMSSRPLRYKIARLSTCKVKVKRDRVFWPVCMEVFDPSKWAWRIASVFELPFGVLPASIQPIVVQGCVYTLLNNKDILEFDLLSERLRILPNTVSAHAQCYPIYHSFQILKIDHKLAVACRGYDKIWKISTRSNDGSWRLQYKVHEQPWAYHPVLSFDEPCSKLSLSYNIYLFFKGHVVDNSAATPYNLFPYKSDFDVVDLSGRE